MKLTLSARCARMIWRTFMEEKELVQSSEKLLLEHLCLATTSFFLHFIRSGRTQLWKILLTLLKLQMTISETKERLFPILQRCLSHLVKVPTSYPRFDDGPLKGTCLVIDSTPTPIPKPSSKRDQKLYFNFKKKGTRYAMKTQCAIGLDLRIWDVSATHPHSVHDLTVLRQSDAMEMISEEKKALGDSAISGRPI